METKDKNQTLVVSQAADLKKELFPTKDLSLSVTNDTEIEKKAADFVDQLLSFKAGDVTEQTGRKNAVEQMGLDVQKQAAKQSALLRQPINKIATKADEGGNVANALIDLKMKVEELDPGKFDFEPGWFGRTVGMIPGVGNPLKRYFTKFESAQTVIASVMRSLKNGQEELERDNITLVEDQKQMAESGKRLERAIQLGILMDQKIQYKLDREIEASDPKHRFISEELLYPLRQRIMDLQQQLAVSQQGYIATEIIMRNNKELIRGVNRSMSVTISALETAATVAMALANQKIVLDKINAVSQTTSDLISGTAARLKTQGADIHKQASSSQLSIESLKSAFVDLKTAMDDVSNFRINALPQMAQSIIELNKISQEAENTIKKLDEGNKQKPEIKLELE
jgi:uncharacterized protein YaaN involved in tellurite resistance